MHQLRKSLRGEQLYAERWKINPRIKKEKQVQPVLALRLGGHSNRTLIHFFLPPLARAQFHVLYHLLHFKKQAFKQKWKYKTRENLCVTIYINVALTYIFTLLDDGDGITIRTPMHSSYAVCLDSYIVINSLSVIFPSFRTVFYSLFVSTLALVT